MAEVQLCLPFVTSSIIRCNGWTETWVEVHERVERFDDEGENYDMWVDVAQLGRHIGPMLGGDKADVHTCATCGDQVLTLTGSLKRYADRLAEQIMRPSPLFEFMKTRR